MAKKKQILYPVFFMIVLTVFFTFILAFINDITKETIEKQQALIVQNSVLYAFNIDTTDLDDGAILDLFEEVIIVTETSDQLFYTYTIDDDIKGYATSLTGKGLWGTITGHVAFDPSHENLLGVNFTTHSETPGLGGRIDEDQFKLQFRDVSLETTDQLFTYGTGTGGNVDAISGATLTSLAVRDILNLEIPNILEFAKKEGFYEGN